jgi:transaldolase
MLSKDLRIKIFQDGADLTAMIAASKGGVISGFTTNPSLMRKAGISDYKGFARKAIEAIPDLPISFEVFSDDFPAMKREAHEIASWGGNTYVKIPISDTKGTSSAPLIRELSAEGLSLNITAMLTLEQVETVANRSTLARARSFRCLPDGSPTPASTRFP